MTADVQEMERMITGYLAFARGEQAEQAQAVNLSELLEDVAASARRAGANVLVEAPPSLSLQLRRDALRRALTNLLDNARRHAATVMLGVQPLDRFVVVMVDDDGPGIPGIAARAYSAHSRATRRAVPALASPLPATSSAPTAATSCWKTAPWEVCEPACDYLFDCKKTFASSLKKKRLLSGFPALPGPQVDLALSRSVSAADPMAA